MHCCAVALVQALNDTIDDFMDTHADHAHTLAMAREILANISQVDGLIGDRRMAVMRAQEIIAMLGDRVRRVSTPSSQACTSCLARVAQSPVQNSQFVLQGIVSKQTFAVSH